MVECTGLENRRPFTGTVGSNPTPSAMRAQARFGVWRGMVGGHTRVCNSSAWDRIPAAEFWAPWEIELVRSVHLQRHLLWSQVWTCALLSRGSRNSLTAATRSSRSFHARSLS